MKNLVVCLGVAFASCAAAGGAEPPAQLEKTDCRFECLEPNAACTESERVLDTLKLLTQAYIKGDIQTYSEYLADGCSTFHGTSHRLVSGKEAVLEDLRRRFAERAMTPLLSYTIEYPYAKVTGDTAVVTLRAVREVGGEHPGKSEAHITEIFIKEGGKWKKLHYRGQWRKID